MHILTGFTGEGDMLLKYAPLAKMARNGRLEKPCLNLFPNGGFALSHFSAEDSRRGVATFALPPDMTGEGLHDLLEDLKPLFRAFSMHGKARGAIRRKIGRLCARAFVERGRHQGVATPEGLLRQMNLAEAWPAAMTLTEAARLHTTRTALCLPGRAAWKLRVVELMERALLDKLKTELPFLKDCEVSDMQRIALRAHAGKLWGRFQIDERSRASVSLTCRKFLNDVEINLWEYGGSLKSAARKVLEEAWRRKIALADAERLPAEILKYQIQELRKADESVLQACFRTIPPAIGRILRKKCPEYAGAFSLVDIHPRL